MRIKTVGALALIGAILAGIFFVGIYYSIDNQIRRNGFDLRSHSAGPIDTAYHLNLTKIEVADVDALQSYAKELGETTIWYNFYKLAGDNEILSYYFVHENNSTLYFTQYTIVSSPPPNFPSWQFCLIFAGAGCAIIGVMAYVTYKQSIGKQNKE